MKVICIDDRDFSSFTRKGSILLGFINNERYTIQNMSYASGLTLGKVYDVLCIYYYDSYGVKCEYETNRMNYIIIDDNGWESRYTSIKFKTVDEVRNDKLIELGI